MDWLAHSIRCVVITAFGRVPVEPEVNSSLATVSPSMAV